MRRSINIAKQAGKPEGWLGKLIAFIMSFETSKANKIALDLLEIQPNDKILGNRSRTQMPSLKIGRT